MPEAGKTTPPAPPSAETSASPPPNRRRSRDVLRSFALLVCVLGLGGLGTYALVRETLDSGAYTDGEQLLDAKRLPDRRRVVWVEPQALAGDLNSADREAAASPAADGETLVLAVGQPGANVEIWTARKDLEGAWIDRRPLAEVNSLADDQAPVLVGNRLYFASNRSGGFGGFDLYVSEIRDGGFDHPRNLGPLINSAADDLDPCADAQGFRLVFASDRAAPGRRFDLFESTGDGELYGEARRIESIASSTSHDRFPCLTPDSLGLIFASNRDGGEGGFDLYRAVWDGLAWMGPFEAGSVNGERDDVAPRLTADGFTLYFASDREGGAGDLDLYRAESRELFPIAADLDLYDKIAGTILLFILTLLLLLFLGNRWKALDIIAKCLLLSLLLHLLLLLWFRTIEVTGDIVQREAGGKSFRVRVLSNPSASERPEANRARDGAVSLERQLAAVDPSTPTELVSESQPELQPAAMEAERLARAEGAQPERQERTEERSQSTLEESLPASESLPTESFARRSGSDAEFALSNQSVEVTRQEVSSGEAPIPTAASEVETTPREIRRSRGQLQGELEIARSNAEASASDRSEPSALPSEAALAVERPVQVRRGVEATFTAAESKTPIERASDPTTGAATASRPRPESERTVLTPNRPADVSAARAQLPAVANAGRPDASGPERRTQPTVPQVEALTAANAPTSAPRRTGEDPAPTALTATPIAAGRADPSLLEDPSAFSELHPAPRVDGASPSEVTGATAERVAIAERGSDRAQPSFERQSSAAPEAARPLEVERVELALRAVGKAAPAASPLRPRDTEVARSTVAAPTEQAILAPRALSRLDAPRRPQPDLRRSAPPSDPTRRTERPHATPDHRSSLDLPEETRPLEVESPVRTALSDDAPQRQDDPGTATKLSPQSSEMFTRRDVFDLAPRSLTADVAAPQPKRWAPDRLDRRPSELLADRTPERVKRSPYQARFGDEKRLALETFGGNEASERAVQSGLRYLASIQNDDGSWGRTSHRHSKYRQVGIGKTGLALLAFLGAGHTQFSETSYSKLVRRTIQHLLENQQDRTGHFGDSNAYSHGIATYALAENYALTGDETVRPALERAIAWILRNQRRDESEGALYGGWGYYLARGTPQDRWPRASVTAWQIMALESARIGGLEIPSDALAAARTYLENSFDRRGRYFRYSHDPARLRSDWATLPGSTPASVFALQLLGMESDDVRLELGVRFIRERTPRGYARASDDDFVLNAQANLYFWYYATLAMFLRGGEDWEYWNAHIRDMLVGAQNDDGSWTPISQYADYANDTRQDRSYTTAMCVLMLEVYYRYFTPLLREQARIDSGSGRPGGR